MQRNTAQPVRCMTQRGFSFLEAVLAAALLAIVASAIFSVLGYAFSAERNDTIRLGAAEVANRLIVSYLDDSTSVKKTPATISYGQDTFRWDIEVDEVRIEEPNHHLRVTAGREGAVPTALVRLKEIRVTVWLDDATAATLTPGSTPGVRINRLSNPIAYRGSDSLERFFEDPERITEMLKNLTGFEDPNAGGDE